MKALIIEDEKAALRNLKMTLQEVDSTITIAGETDSITDTLQWLNEHPMPDLVFMDIHLADGSAFEIFNHTRITCPIIFTTAYDEYALKAFKVNSIDYLLKPITPHDLKAALHKLHGLSGYRPKTDANPQQPHLMDLIRKMTQENTARTHFLIPAKGDKFIPLAAEDILYFHITDGCVKAVDHEEREYTFMQTLDELQDMLHPRLFFRANRQFIIAKKAVKDISLWFNHRLAVNLKVPTPEKILISRAKANDFKEWFTG